MTESLPAGAAPCPECGAACQPVEAFCWMCHHRLWDKPAAPTPAARTPAPTLQPPRPPPAATPRDMKSTAVTVNFTLLLIVVGCIFLGGPLGILLLFLVVPGLAASVTGRKPAPVDPDRPKDWKDHLLGALRIIATAVGVIALAGLAICVALFVTCLFVLAASPGHH